MKLVLPELSTTFECKNRDQVNCIVVENQQYMYRILTDINEQLSGNDGLVVLSEDNTLLSIDKNLELINRFVPFDLNQKHLLNRLITNLQKIAVDENNYFRTMEVMSYLEKYLIELSMEVAGNIEFTKMNIENILKASGVEFAMGYCSLGEKLSDYFDLVREYDRDKLFILYNIRSVMSDQEIESFLDTVLMRGHQVLLLETSEHPIITRERRYIIDKDLCEIV